MTRTARRGSALAVLAFLLWGCPGSERPDPSVDDFSVRITRVQSPDGEGGWRDHSLDALPDDPLPYATLAKLTLEIEPRSEQGRRFEGYVEVAIVPGTVTAISSPNATVTRRGIYVTSDEPAIAEVQVEGGFGDARILVEDVGHVPGPAQNARCDDGIDNDGDGLVDYPSDPGCYLRNDDSEEPGTHAVGVSDTVYFANPRVSHVQGCDLVPSLSNEAVQVDRGSLYVTAITVSGFYVTDVAYLDPTFTGCDPPQCCVGGRYAHMYAYNFNTPRGLRVCDRLERVGGIVADFYGFTEFNFPSWVMYDIDQDSSNGLTLMRLEPHDITPANCPLQATEITAEMIPDRRLMETYESGLVQVTDAVLPEDWVNCDFNNNGWVAYNTARDELTPADEVVVPSAYCTPRDGLCSEAECNDACLSRSCAELSNYYEYGQYPVFFDGMSILVVTNSGAPEFDPKESRGGTIGRISGVLKEFAPLDTPWIIEPRCRQDVFIAGDDRFPDVPIYQRCVPSEETGDYEDPY